MGVVLTTALLIAFPWQVLSIGSVLYLTSLPFAFNAQRRLLRSKVPARKAPVSAAKKTAAPTKNSSNDEPST
jgi:CDP-diacylglycerol--serine O-phosphatidyltransferase